MAMLYLLKVYTLVIVVMLGPIGVVCCLIRVGRVLVTTAASGMKCLLKGGSIGEQQNATKVHFQ